MKILNLTVRNFLKIEVAELSPDGNLVVVAGPNEAGKSSLIGAVWAALGGADAAPERPIRTGADKAEIIVEVGSGGDDAPRLRVRRVFTEKAPRLEVSEIRPDGTAASFRSPQRMLDALYGAIAFDPMSFFDQPAGAQAETLSALVGLDVSDLDAEHERVYAERRDLNRDIKAMGECPAPAGERTETVDVGAVSAALAEAKAASSAKLDAQHDQRARRETIERLRAGIEERQHRIEALHAEIGTMTERAEAAEREAETADRAIAEMGNPNEREAELMGELQEAQSRNAAATAWEATADKFTRWKQMSGLSDTLTERLAGIATAREERIAAVDMPLDGLAIEDGIVTFEGVPVSQASTARRLEIGARIGLAQKPRLKVLRVEHGSLLDSRMFDRMRALADELGVQWWVERVADEDDGTGFYIEDGRLAERESDAQGSLLDD